MCIRDRPTIIIHARNDDVVPVGMAVRLDRRQRDNPNLVLRLKNTGGHTPRVDIAMRFFMR